MLYNLSHKILLLLLGQYSLDVNHVIGCVNQIIVDVYIYFLYNYPLSFLLLHVSNSFYRSMACTIGDFRALLDL